MSQDPGLGGGVTPAFMLQDPGLGGVVTQVFVLQDPGLGGGGVHAPRLQGKYLAAI